MILYGNKDMFKNSTNHIDKITVDQSVPTQQLTYALESLSENNDGSLKKLKLHLFRSEVTVETVTDTDTNILSSLASMSNEILESQIRNLILNSNPRIALFTTKQLFSGKKVFRRSRME